MAETLQLVIIYGVKHHLTFVDFICVTKCCRGLLKMFCMSSILRKVWTHYVYKSSSARRQTKFGE